MTPVRSFAAAILIMTFGFSSTALAWTPAYAPTETAVEIAPAPQVPAHVFTRILGDGLRIGFTHSLFVAADYRHRAVRHTMGDMLRGAVIVTGTYEHEQKGDAGAILFGAGFQF
jgi:hypothetical protein